MCRHKDLTRRALDHEKRVIIFPVFCAQLHHVRALNSLACDLSAKGANTAVFGTKFVFAELEGVDTMEQAEALKGTVLYAAREDLGIPEGVLLIAEMKGMKVWNAHTGAQLGTLADVIHPANTDIYVIRTEKGEAMVPVVPEFVQRVDEEEGIFLTPIEGMFD